MKAFIATLLAAMLFLGAAGTALAQQEVGIPFHDEPGYVLGRDAACTTFTLNLTDAGTLTTASTVEAALSENARLTGPHGVAVACDALTAGMKVTVSGVRYRSGFELNALTVRSAPTREALQVEGIFEVYEDGMAYVGGQRVVLAAGTRVRGTEAWEGLTFDTFDALQLGAFVKLDGHRDASGLMHADAGTAWPNVYTSTEVAVREALKEGRLTPDGLSGGRMQVGEETYRLVQDLRLQAYVNEVGAKLLPAYLYELPEDDPSRVTFRFYVVDDQSVNASAFPNGVVIVHKGLLDALENEAQLAAVLGHEIAHVTHEHGVERFEKSRSQQKRKKTFRFIRRGVKAVTGRDYGSVNIAGIEVDLGQVHQLGEGLLSNRYSREREAEADRIGLFYMVQAGYDPREAPLMWQQMAATSAGGSSIPGVARIENLFASHADAEARAQDLLLELTRLSTTIDPATLERGEERYHDRINR